MRQKYLHSSKPPVDVDVFCLGIELKDGTEYIRLYTKKRQAGGVKKVTKLDVD